MKKYILALVIGISVLTVMGPGRALAFSTAWSPTSAPVEAWRGIVSSADGSRIVAVSYGGLYMSTDYGVTWTSPVTVANYYSVAMSPDGKYIWVGVSAGTGSPGRMMKSSDYGATWAYLPSFVPMSQYPKAAVSADGKHVVICGDSGVGADSCQLIHSDNYGSTWVASSPANMGHTLKIAFSGDASKVLLGTEGAGLYKSTDYGATFTALSPTGSEFRAIAISSDGSHIITSPGWSPSILVSSSAGASWSTVTLPSLGGGFDSWLGGTMSNDGKYILMTNDGREVSSTVHDNHTIWYSSDYGGTWTDVSLTAVPNNPWRSTMSADGQRAYLADSSGGQIWSNETRPIVTTDSASATPTTATLHGTLTDIGDGSTVTAGFKYATDAEYASGSGSYPHASATGSMTATGAFSQTITGLSCNTIYHYKSLGTNDVGTAFGGDLLFGTFTTGPCSTAVASVTTNSATGLSSTGATLNGHLSALSGSPSMEVEFRYSTTSGFTSGSTSTASSVLSSPGDFSQPVTGLTCNTAYYYRAYAVVSGFVAATGDEQSFVTPACPILMSTNTATVSSSTSATLSGALVSAGTGSTVTARFRYGLTTAYGTTTTATSLSTPGVYTVAVTGLACGTTYHFQAYGSSGSGSGYGADNTFTMTGACGSPAVATQAIWAGTTTGGIALGTTNLNGTLTFTGGYGATTVGFNYGLTTAYGSTVTVPGTMAATGPFYYTLGGLTCGATYHYQAIANGPGGKAQGIDKTFVAPQTVACLTAATNEATAITGLGLGGGTGTPVVITNPATDITSVTGVGTANVSGTATLAGGLPGSMNFTFDFGPTTSYGLYMPPNMPLPTASPFTFTAGVGGLVCGSTYHYRAKIVTSTTTIYGLDRTFVACTPAPHSGSTGGASVSVGTTVSTAVSSGQSAFIPVNGGIPLTSALTSSIQTYFTQIFGKTSTTKQKLLSKASVVFTANGQKDAVIASGDSVTLNWTAENIQSYSCVGDVPIGTLHGWANNYKAPLTAMAPDTITTYAEVIPSVTKDMTLSLVSCKSTDGTKIPDQTVTITIGGVSADGNSSSKSSTSTTTSGTGRKLQWTEN